MTGSILVTGGSKGIGLAIARRFHAGGFATTVCARNAATLAALQRELPGLQAIECDVGDPAQVSAMVAQVRAQTGVPDILVNNAGTYLPGQLHDEDDGVLEAMLRSNLFGAYRVTRGFLPGMMARKSGTIVNVCSTASIVPYVNGGSYCIAKHALHGFSKTLREEMKPHGVRVVALLPGATLTASWEGVDLPPERFMPPEDIAEIVWSACHVSPRTVVEDILVRPMLGDIA